MPSNSNLCKEAVADSHTIQQIQGNNKFETKRRVHFFPSVKVRSTISRSRCWWSEMEYQWMRNSNAKLVQLLSNKTSGKETSSSNKPLYTRGLECYGCLVAAIRAQNRRDALQAVMVTQEEQNALGITDPEEIA